MASFDYDQAPTVLARYSLRSSDNTRAVLATSSRRIWSTPSPRRMKRAHVFSLFHVPTALEVLFENRRPNMRLAR